MLIPNQSALSVGFVVGSSTDMKSTPASPPPRRLEVIFDWGSTRRIKKRIVEDVNGEEIHA